MAAKKRMYILSDGELKRKQNTLCFISNDGKRFIPVEGVSDFVVFGEVTLNKKLLEFLTKNKIIMHFFNHYGYYVGTYYPREYYNSGLILLKQVEFYLDSGKRLFLAKKFVLGAVQNMLKVVTYYVNRRVDDTLLRIKTEMENMLSQIELCEGVSELMGIEGMIRDVYYKAIDIVIDKEGFSFERRTRRPPENRLNALISFMNSLLYVEVLSAIYRTHLDPRIGYLHSTNMRRFTLNLDVSEVFKPILVDRTILSVLNKKIIKVSDFSEKLNGIYLKDKGREKVIEEWEDKLSSSFLHRKLKRNVSYRELIRLELYKIEKHILGDQEYSPFVMRW